MPLHRSLPACAVPLLLAACASAPRTATPTAEGGGPSPAAAVDTTTGGRWYGYEGGLKDAEEAAASIEGATQYWQSVEGRWRTEEDSGSYRAYFRDRHLRHLAVTFAGANGTGSGAYTYDDRARLFHYHGDMRRRTGAGRSARTQRVTLSVAVDPKGAASATRRTVAGTVQPLAQDELRVVMAREAAAREAALRVLTAGER